MKKNNILVQISLITTLATSMPLIEASAFRILAATTARRALNHRALGAITAGATACGVEAASQAQKAPENQEQSPGYKLTIRHKVDFDSKGTADNFSTQFYSTGSYYNSNAEMENDLHKKTIKYGPLDWIFDRLMLTKEIHDKHGDYSFAISARSGIGEAQFKSSPVNSRPKIFIEHGVYEANNQTPWMTVKMYRDDNAKITKILNQHIIGKISKNGTRGSLQVQIIEEGANFCKKTNVKIQSFTQKGCEQNYQRDLTNKETTESEKENYIKRCLYIPKVRKTESTFQSFDR